MTVVDLSQRTLEERAETLRGLAAEGDRSARDELERRMEMGDLLLEVRKIFPGNGNGWNGWIEESRPAQHTPVSWAIALRRCMRLALHREVIEGRGAENITQAIGMVKGLGRQNVASSAVSAEIKKEAQYLRGLGLTYAQIGEAVGHRGQSVRYWLDPEALARARASAERTRHRRTAEKKALEREERAQAIRALPKGAAPAEAYNGFRKYGDRLDQAIREASSREAKEKYEAAYTRFTELTALLEEGARLDSAPTPA